MLCKNTFYSAANDLSRQANLSSSKNKSLQAQAVNPFQKRKRASCFAPCPRFCRGSATVEAALLLPVFLSAVCALIMMGQLLLVEGEIQHAVSKTAMICAKQESVSAIYGKTGSSDLPLHFAEPTVAFYSVFQGSDLCSGCIVGGSRGITVSMQKPRLEAGRIRVTAVYALKIPLPFVGKLYTMKKVNSVRRMYTGYILHKGEGDDDDDDRIVYLTKHGSVYHTSLSCTHISLRISGSLLTVKSLEARGVRRCEKCIKKNQIPESLYITAEGDCYHSRLSCSGLKRTVKAVRLSEVRGMRICGRCAMSSGK